MYQTNTIWKAKLKNNETINELMKEVKWDDIKKDVVSLCLITKDKQIISLPDNMEEYYQGKSAVGDLGNGKITIISRYIAFRKGNIITRIRINEQNNNISIEQEQI